MKTKLFILAIATLISIQTVFSQTEKQVTSIRTEVTAINKAAKKYSKKTKNVEGISLEGTEATYFTSGKGLKKITAKMYGETFKATAELYYQGEELIFAYEKMNRYNGHIAMNPSPKIAKVEEKRLYFSGGKLIKLLIGKVNVKEGSQQWIESEGDMVDLAKTLKDAH